MLWLNNIAEICSFSWWASGECIRFQRRTCGCYTCFSFSSLKWAGIALSLVWESLRSISLIPFSYQLVNPDWITFPWVPNNYLTVINQNNPEGQSPFLTKKFHLKQVLEYRVFNICNGSQPIRGRLPLTPGSCLTWFGFSEGGQLSSFDSYVSLNLPTIHTTWYSQLLLLWNFICVCNVGCSKSVYKSIWR